MTKIANLATELLEKGIFSPENLANVVAHRAFEDSLKDDFDSPFAQEARRSGYKGYMGGKSDDISVSVGRVMLNPKKKEEGKDSPAASIS